MAIEMVKSRQVTVYTAAGFMGYLKLHYVNMLRD
jgi:hypothetical protein